MTPSRIVWTKVDDRIVLHLYACPDGDTRRCIAKAVGCQRLHAGERLERMLADGIATRRKGEATTRAGQRPYVYALTDAGRMRAKLCAPTHT